MNIPVKLSKIAPNDQESVKIVPRGSLANSWIANTFITVVSELFSIWHDYFGHNSRSLKLICINQD